MPSPVRELAMVPFAEREPAWCCPEAAMLGRLCEETLAVLRETQSAVAIARAKVLLSDRFDELIFSVSPSHRSHYALATGERCLLDVYFAAKRELRDISFGISGPQFWDPQPQVASLPQLKEKKPKPGGTWFAVADKD